MLDHLCFVEINSLYFFLPISLNYTALLPATPWKHEFSPEKILALSPWKAFADVAQVVRVFFDRVENIVRKVENAGCQLFLLIP